MKLVLLKNAFFPKKISSKTLHFFTHHLAILIQAGLPLLPSLAILEKQLGKTKLNQAITNIIAALHEGKSFSNALGEYPALFSKDYRSMVQAGERGGVLGDVLYQLALLVHQRQKLHQKLFSILLYPLIVLIAAGLILGALFLFVVPQFEHIFTEILSEKPLPFLTQFILTLEHDISHHPYSLAFGSLFLLGSAFFFSKTTSGRLWRDQLLLKTPFINQLFQKAILARFARTAGMLLANGVPLLQALALGKETTGSPATDHLFEAVSLSIEQGASMTASLRQHSFFPPLIINMVEVGESTGQLPQMLLNVATYYEEELEHLLDRLLTLLEPCLILILALITGTVIIALFLPLVTLIGDIGN